MNSLRTVYLGGLGVLSRAVGSEKAQSWEFKRQQLNRKARRTQRGYYIPKPSDVAVPFSVDSAAL